MASVQTDQYNSVWWLGKNNFISIQILDDQLIAFRVVQLIAFRVVQGCCFRVLIGHLLH